MSSRKSHTEASLPNVSLTASTRGRINSEMAIATTASLKFTKRSNPRSVRRSGFAGIRPMMAAATAPTPVSPALRWTAGTLRSVTRVLSCIQPTGDVHLGNYLGALRNWVAGQHEADAFHGIVDLHALTVTEEPGVIGQSTTQLAAMLFAIGLDPDVATVFVQSHVVEHSQLAWVMECTVSYGELTRMTQFKDKSAKRGVHLRRAVHLPGAAGGRHPALRRQRGAGGRRPAPARRDHA